MKKINKDYLERALYLAFSLCICVLFIALVFSYDTFVSVFKNALKLLSPVLWGFALAYLLLPAVRRLEHLILNRMQANSRRGAYMVAVLLTYLFFLLALYLFFRVLLPQLMASIVGIVGQLTTYANTMADWVVALVETLSLQEWFVWTSSDISTWAVARVGDVAAWLVERYPYLIGKTIGLASTVFNMLISFVISIYVVLERDLFVGQTKKMLFALLPKRSVELTLKVTNDADSVFGGFIRGKMIDSLIIGLLCLGGLYVLDIPEKILVSAVVCVTNMIPTFGPFLGGIPCVILMLFIDFWAGVRLALFIIVLQQFDGNVLGPKILGDTLGISAFWIVFAVLVFGKIFGIIGMFLGVPMMALIYKEVGDFVNARLRKKQYETDSLVYAQGDYDPAEHCAQQVQEQQE